jgi:hypothetical protein
MSSACNIDFVFEVAGDRNFWTRGLPYQHLKQRGHACEADNVVRLRTHQGGCRHFGKGGVAGIMNDGNAAGLLQRRKTGCPISLHPREDDTDGPAPATEGRRAKHRIERRSGVVFARAKPQPQMPAFACQLCGRWRED